MNKTVLSIEESARLIELGVPKSISTVQYCKIYDNPNEQYPTVFRLEDLLRILPKRITDRKRIYELRMGITDTLMADEQWFVKYSNTIDDCDDLDTWISASELIDAVYQEICYLKTNGYVEL